MTTVIYILAIWLIGGVLAYAVAAGGSTKKEPDYYEK